EKQKAINSNQIENLQRDIAVSTKGIEERKGEIEQIEVGLKDLEGRQKIRAKELDALEQSEARRQEDIVETERLIEESRKQIANVNRQLDAKRNEFKLTKSMVDNLEGFPESIKFLSKQKKWAEEMPLLSDLIYVDKDYRVAIENYLNPFLNYYVVKDMKQAYEAIQLLGKSQKGKANFFVLESIKDYDPPMPLFPNAQRAIDKIQVDEPYRKLFSHLLENVLVTDSEEPSDELKSNDVVLLSKSGRFIQRKYSISGGSVGLFEGKKIGRKKNLEVLELAIKKLEKEETKLSTGFYNLRTRLDKLKSGIQSAAINREREALNQIAQKKVSLLTRLENFENFLRDATEKNERSKDLIKSMSAANKDIDQKLEERNNKLKESKAQITDMDDSFRKIAEQLSAASAAYNNQHIEFIRQQNKVTALQQELTFREKQQQETEYTLTNNQKAIEKGEIELQEVDFDIKELEKALLENYDGKKEKEESLTQAEQSYFQARGGINEIEEKLRSLNRKRQETQVLIGELKDGFNGLKLEFTSIGERLKIEFNVSMEEVLKREPNPDIKVEETQPKVDRLKQRLDNYGEINPMAVEAFDEMKERYDNIATQRDDIVEAKKSLLDTIKEIETTATTHFMEAFTKAREYFIEVFRSLFSEDDKCDLTLLNPEDPLNSPIEITAKPKGKRPLSISQLSGGEKTLTATALLFALYLLKPAPFCIFDEVDAPLDDANIEKFNRIIRKFSKESQFIIVTHNKATMTAVDVIYGVFMQEMGVSQVNAVDFRELDHVSALEVVN
ncbi:MAG: AAA family ATPase, partial [Bacteroidota bacterium]